MTSRPRHPNSGRRCKLTHDERREVEAWHTAVLALGTQKAAMKRAADEWRKARHALGYGKHWCERFDICPETLNKYLQGLHKDAFMPYSNLPQTARRPTLHVQRTRRDDPAGHQAGD